MILSLLKMFDCLQCYNLAEEYEPELEEWFHKKRKKDVDLHKSLCIDHIKGTIS